MLNTMKTFMLLAALTALFGAIGYLIGGGAGLIVALVFAVVLNFASYWYSDVLVLKATRARVISYGELPWLHDLVDNLTQSADLPKPMVCVIDKPTPNAFATGRSPNHAAVAVTTGLLEMLDRDELEGVLAHELAHIQHRDILIGTVTATVVGAISIIAMIGRFAFLFGGMGGQSDDEGGGSILGALLLMILAPIIATILQLAISRSREYAADRGAAEMTGHPEALASALNKLAWGNLQMPEREPQPSTAHMKIVSPFSAKRGGSTSGLSGLFSTHPPIEERVRRLRAMAR